MDNFIRDKIEKEGVFVFNLLFWGLLFMFDVPVGNIDILPDVVGYVLMYVGLKQLTPFHRLFGSAKQLSIILIVLSIFTIYSNLERVVGYIPMILFHIVYMALNMLFMYRICYAIVELAREAELPRLAQAAGFRCSLYLASMLFTPIIILLGLVQSALAGMIFLPAFLFSIIVLVLLMALMKQADQSLKLNPYV